MELLKQLNAIRDATNRSLLMNNNRTDGENVPNTIPPITPSGAGDDVSDEEERMFKKEEEEMMVVVTKTTFLDDDDEKSEEEEEIV